MIALTALLGRSRRDGRTADAAKLSSLKRLIVGGLVPTRSAIVPGKMSLKIPKPVRSTDFGSNCQAIAILGCKMATGVDENRWPR